jgi:phosphatidylserine decarboxylase
MSDYPHPIIAREGWAFVALALVVAIALSLAQLWWLAAVAWAALLFVVQFFRDPPRAVPAERPMVVSFGSKPPATPTSIATRSRSACS